MSTESVCRICVENAKSYKNLYDSNGQKSDVYLLVVKYFDETIINFERAQHLKGVCVKCLQKIQFFDHFQKSVIRAQEKLLDDHNEVKRENILTGYEEEFSLFHINDKSKHELPVKENNVSSQYNNDAVCVRPEESDHIEVPKLEIVDAFSGDESIQSNHEEFLDSPLRACSLHTEFSVTDDGRNQNLDQNDSSNIEKSVETSSVNKLTNKSRSPKAIDDYIAKFVSSVECGMCQKKLPTFTCLLQHFTSEHPAKKCYAVCCERMFKTRYKLASHVEHVHSGPNAYSCKYCKKSFMLRRSLMAHMRAHNPIKSKVSPQRSPDDIDDYIAKFLPSIECGICKEKQPTYSLLTLHFTVDHPEKECYAMCCDKRFKWRSSLARHLYCLHSGIYPYSCKLCKKSFKLRKSLILHHINVHKHGLNQKYRTSDTAIAQLRPSLECVLCKETSTTYSLLQLHFKSKHPLEKFYIRCCNRKLKSRYDLHQHLQLHENPNAFKCDVCDKAFGQPTALSRHMRVLHPNDNNITKLLTNVECGMCKEKQPTYAHLLQHFKSEHPAKECHATCCGTVFKKGSKLAKHVYCVHPPRFTTEWDIAHLRPNLECVICKDTCTTFSLLQYHFESNHPLDEFYIMCCNRKLKDRTTLLEHLQFHENPNAFKCEMCNKSFTQRKSIVRHMRSYHHTSNVGVPKHVNDPINTSDCNNDATCVLPEESKHIEVPKLEIVDVFSGDESTESCDEEF